MISRRMVDESMSAESLVGSELGCCFGVLKDRCTTSTPTIFLEHVVKELGVRVGTAGGGIGTDGAESPPSKLDDGAMMRVRT